MSNWFRIDDPENPPPKDGTEIIGIFWRLYGFENETPTIYGPWTIRWSVPDEDWISSWDGSEVIESQTDFGTTWRTPDPEVTHWHPLPAPPAQEPPR